jgi:hypothetical protein
MRTPFLVSFALLASCGNNPPPPSTVRARIASDLGNVLHETKNASDATTTNLPTGQASLLTGLALGNATNAARQIPGVSRMASLLAPRAGNHNALPGSTSFDPDATIEWLNDNIFTDANYLGNGIYQVPPELFCTTETVDSLGNVVDTVDPDCVSRVTTADLRVRVEEDDSTLRFAIQLDANHDEPLVFALSHTSLAITIDLDGADRAIIALAAAFGQQAPNASLSGQLTGKLEVLGSAHAKLSSTIDRAMSIKVAPQGESLDGDNAVRFASAAAQVLSIELDGNAPLLAVDLGIGETTAHLPGSSGSPSTDIDLAGLTGNATFDGGNTLQVDNISLGNKTTTISKGGAQAIAIDVNPTEGRTLSATITADPATGTDTLSVLPRLDVQLAIDHAVLGDTPPVYDVTRVQLDGSLAGLPGSNVVRVGGGFAIATNPAQYGFIASAGQCVTSTDTYDSTSGQYYTAYSVGVCN